MRSIVTRGSVWAIAALGAAGLAGCGDSDATGPPRPTVPNFVHLRSDAGDFIGAGRTYNYTHANAIFDVATTGGYLRILIYGDEWWDGDFHIPGTPNRLQPGLYTAGSLDWGGEGRGCGSRSGWFAIDSVAYQGDVLAAVDLRFEQQCHAASGALHGTIHWQSDDNTVPPGPVHPVPGGLWRPSASFVPPAGSFIYLESDAGDFIGQGFTRTYTPANANAAVLVGGGYLRIDVNVFASHGGDWWVGEFLTMNSVTRLEPGYYPELRRYSFHNPTKGGLDWSGSGRVCNRLLGWFAIDDIEYDDDAVNALTLRFQQRCDGENAALHGLIHLD